MTSRSVTIFFILAAWRSVFAGRADLDSKSNIQISKSFPDHAFQNIIKEANEFFHNLTAAKTASVAADAKLSELKSALTQQTNKSSSAILLPSGWDKKSIVDALTKSLNQNKQIQELSERFIRFMSEIKKFEESETKNPQIVKENAKESSQGKNKTEKSSFSGNQNGIVGNPSSLDNSTLMGKLVGFIKTGRRLGSVELSDLNPCSEKGACDRWKKGLENLRNFFSKSSSKLADLFKNSATLKKLAEQSSDTSPKNKIDNSKKLKNKNSTISSIDSAKQPVDYFDYYYNGNDETNRKKSANRTDSKIIGSQLKKNVSASSSNNVLTGAKKEPDYFDYYYNQGIPSIILNRTKFIGGKIGG